MSTSIAIVELERQASQRHALILASADRSLPRAFRGYDARHEYVPLREAALRMNLDERDVIDLVERGILNAEGDTIATLRVQPAIVSTVAVRQR